MLIRDLTGATLGAMSLDHSLVTLADSQHGVVARRQLLEMGMTAAQIRTRRAHCVLVPRHRGVYAVGRKRLPWLGTTMAAVLAGGEDAIASHLTAAGLWNLRKRCGLPHVLVPRRHLARPGIVFHESELLVADDISERDGIRCTSLPLTLLQLASLHGPGAAARAVEASIRSGDFDRGPIRALLARRPEHPGAGALRAALAFAEDEPGMSRGRLEDEFFTLLQLRGIATPLRNAAVGPYEVDALYLEARIAIELDSRTFHGNPFAVERDVVRDQYLALRGFRVIRFTWRQILNEPDLVAGIVAQALAIAPGRAA